MTFRIKLFVGVLYALSVVCLVTGQDLPWPVAVPLLLLMVRYIGFSSERIASQDRSIDDLEHVYLDLQSQYIQLKRSYIKETK